LDDCIDAQRIYTTKGDTAGAHAYEFPQAVRERAVIGAAKEKAIALLPIREAKAFEVGSHADCDADVVCNDGLN